VTGEAAQPAGYDRRRTSVSSDRFLIAPFGLAGSRWELAAAGACAMSLGGVFVSEILTPNDALIGLGLPPLLAANWALSRRLAGAVSVMAVAMFAVVVSFEAADRLTIVSIGAVALLLAVTIRLYAARLAALLADRGSRRVTPAPSTDARTHGIEGLTRREVEVARLASLGCTDSEIASRLGISIRTAESHLAHIYAKLGVTSRRVLIRMSSDFGAARTGD
jgi:DNA-binding CsgD family transcriptional regulator